eukprot:jgi/Hompol1/716/HPOL_002416-RA
MACTEIDWTNDAIRSQALVPLRCLIRLRLAEKDEQADHSRNATPEQASIVNLFGKASTVLSDDEPINALSRSIDKASELLAEIQTVITELKDRVAEYDATTDPAFIQSLHMQFEICSRKRDWKAIDSVIQKAQGMAAPLSIFQRFCDRTKTRQTRLSTADAASIRDAVADLQKRIDALMLLVEQTPGERPDASAAAAASAAGKIASEAKQLKPADM